mgnify:CR=1 FL=1
MRDLEDILPHLAHANAVQGGAMLFAGDRVAPLLLVEEFVEPRRRFCGRINPAVRVSPAPRGGRRHAGNSAEAIRAIKASMGVKPNPTTDPVDKWSQRR